MATPYIPPADVDFRDWLDNFSGLITAVPATYGLTGGNAVTIAAQQAAYSAALAIALAPATRTAPTIADKDAAKAAALAVVRPFAVSISLNSGVADLDKTAVGVTVRKIVPTPIPPPLTNPVLTLQSATPLRHVLNYRDSATPASKAKPFGAIGLQLFRAVGTVPAVDPAQASFYTQWTKSPNNSDFEAGDRGKVCTYFARWITQGGPGGTVQYGPFGAGLALSIM
jgi:hypothetical protein